MLGDYMRAVLPVQLLAFTSCSSAACLPVNMEQMRKLGLPHNVISFVLPTGITINMNGTSLLPRHRDRFRRAGHGGST